MLNTLKPKINLCMRDIWHVENNCQNGSKMKPETFFRFRESSVDDVCSIDLFWALGANFLCVN